MAFMDFFDSTAGMIGVPTDQFILVVTLFVSVPIGLIQFFLIRGEFLRHAFSIICGLSLLLLQFHPKDLIHFTIVSIVVYGMLLIMPRNRVALPVLVFSLLYLSSMHIYRIITDYMG